MLSMKKNFVAILKQSTLFLYNFFFRIYIEISVHCYIYILLLHNFLEKQIFEVLTVVCHFEIRCFTVGLKSKLKKLPPFKLSNVRIKENYSLWQFSKSVSFLFVNSYLNKYFTKTNILNTLS